MEVVCENEKNSYDVMPVCVFDVIMEYVQLRALSTCGYNRCVYVKVNSLSQMYFLFFAHWNYILKPGIVRCNCTTDLEYIELDRQ